ncbi:unnamed protein product [Rhizopus stolonifer]
MPTEAFNSLKINKFIQDRHFYWWLGHVCVVLNGIFYFSSVLSFHTNPAYYKRAYVSVLLSYLIVLYNSISNVEKVGIDFLYDENAHYFAIAFYWFSTPPVTVTLLPFFIFSIFHVINYTRIHLEPKVEKGSLVEQLDDQLRKFSENFCTTAMQYSAHIEVILIPCRLMMGILLFKTSILSIIVFMHFLHLRYYLSHYSQEAVHNVAHYLDNWLLLPQQNTAWAVVSNIYTNSKRSRPGVRHYATSTNKDTFYYRYGTPLVKCVVLASTTNIAWQLLWQHYQFQEYRIESDKTIETLENRIKSLESQQ